MIDWHDADTRPQKYGWAPGYYTCTCTYCNEGYMGSKRSVMCADCAYGQVLLEEYNEFDGFTVLHSKEKGYFNMVTFGIYLPLDFNRDNMSAREVVNVLAGMKKRGVVLSLETEMWIAKESK